jgi:hypothetical protein
VVAARGGDPQSALQGAIIGSATAGGLCGDAAQATPVVERPRTQAAGAGGDVKSPLGVTERALVGEQCEPWAQAGQAQ